MLALQNFTWLSLFAAVTIVGGKFPPGFKFGAATSAYQIEGGWNRSDAGESNWDRMIHSHPGSIVDGSNADVAADSYRLWKEDIQIAEDLGLHFYRFSISWSRILPTGYPNKISKDGVQYYNKLIDRLLEKGIEPVVTIFHNILPQKLADLGGWVNPLMVEWFADYARVLYNLYGDRVKTWITINEPMVICDFTYYVGTFPPNVLDPLVAPFLCSRHVLLAHAKAWRIYDEEYRVKYNGRLSLSNCPMWMEPATPADQELAETVTEFGLGRFAHAIFSERGGWPPTVEKLMTEHSVRMGFPQSILPSFTDAEIEYIKGTYDFYSLNYYSGYVVREARADEQPGVWFVNGSREMNAIFYSDPSWEITSFYGFPAYPQGLRKTISWINRHYGNISIFISENGYPSLEGDLYDEKRMRFFQSHLEQVMLSIKDGANVEAFTVWSLMDTFEWISGYGVKFGLYHVDYSDPGRKRTPRLSAHYYRHVIKHHSHDSPPFVPDMERDTPRGGVAVKDAHDGIKYHLVRKGSERGCYQLHRPTECRLKFPITKRPIHKCELPKREYTLIPQIGGWRVHLVPKKQPNLYPAVMHKNEYERLKKQAKIVTQEEQIAAMKAQEEAIQKAARESEERKRKLKEQLKPQPGAEAATGAADPELEGPDQAAYTLSRAEMIRADCMQGPKLCNRIILASKCHAIRDAQIAEKEIIKKELTEEERRLDAIMEENRQAAVRRAEAEEQRRHELRLQNLAALKEQIKAHDTVKIMEAERIEEESIRVNQANIAMQIDDAQRLKEKQMRQAKLKEILDQGNAELLYYKQLQNEEERIMDVRIKNFLKKKQEREAKNRAEAEAIKAAKQKGIDHIAKAQKAEQELKEELERIRNLKIQEDVEREYRRRERDAAIRRNLEMKRLHEAREQQINDIHRLIAREIAKDEQSFNNAARQNEEFIRKERELEEKRKARIESHRQEIMKQINDKERMRAELREKIHNEGVALRMEQDRQEQYERKVIKQKVAAMRQQKVPEKYVKEVEQTLGKHGY